MKAKRQAMILEIVSTRDVQTQDQLQEALQQAGLSRNDIDAVAVTYAPGLIGAVLVGLSFAKSMAYALNVPLIPVHHIRGHIAANYLAYPDLEPPFLCLVVSGGHTHLVSVKDYGEYEILGRTMDDAAGEAFDKVARAIGLGYPGGPKIDKLSKEGDPLAIKFPRVRMEKDCLDFSFSGVKTSVINYLHKAEQQGVTVNSCDVAASFQAAVTDVLSEHTIEAAKIHNLKTITIAGGVASNSDLREKMSRKASEFGIDVLYPPPVLCTDNAAMIACAGYYSFLEGNFASLDLNAVPSLSIEI